MMANATYARDKAEQCRRLARGITDGPVAKRLLAMAGEFGVFGRAERKRDYPTAWEHF